MEPLLTATFGIEIEFVLAFSQANHAHQLHPLTRKAWATHDKYFQDLVDPAFRIPLICNLIDVLEGAGFPVNDVHDPKDYSKWTVDTDSSVKVSDDSASEESLQGMHFLGMELKTPIFFWKEKDRAFAEVNHALEILQRKFKIFTNDTCGLHVHVGNQDLGFPLATIQPLAKFVTVFERQLASLHPAHRITNQHCRAPSTNFPGMTTQEKATSISNANDLKILAQTMSSNTDGDPRGFAYNFRNLIVSHETNTVEFRLHEGTLDARAISAWASLVVELVRKSYDGRGIEELVERHIDDGGYTVINLLDDLELPELVAYYRQKGVYDHPVPDPASELDKTLVSKLESMELGKAGLHNGVQGASDR